MADYGVGIMNKIDTTQTIKILKATKKAGIGNDRRGHLTLLSFFVAFFVLRGMFWVENL